MREAGSVVSRERLIDEVWDVNWFGSTKTLDVHVSALRRKLGDDPGSPRYLHTVRGVGFRFAAPDEASRMSLRARLLLAFAYVLVRRARGARGAAGAEPRRGASTPRSRARPPGQAQLLAASAAGRLDRREELARLCAAPPRTSAGA